MSARTKAYRLVQCKMREARRYQRADFAKLAKAGYSPWIWGRSVASYVRKGP